MTRPSTGFTTVSGDDRFSVPGPMSWVPTSAPAPGTREREPHHGMHHHQLHYPQQTMAPQQPSHPPPLQQGMPPPPAQNHAPIVLAAAPQHQLAGNPPGALPGAAPLPSAPTHQAAQSWIGGPPPPLPPPQIAPGGGGSFVPVGQHPMLQVVSDSGAGAALPPSFATSLPTAMPGGGSSVHYVHRQQPAALSVDGGGMPVPPPPHLQPAPVAPAPSGLPSPPASVAHLTTPPAPPAAAGTGGFGAAVPPFPAPGVVMGGQAVINVPHAEWSTLPAPADMRVPTSYVVDNAAPKYFVNDHRGRRGGHAGGRGSSRGTAALTSTTSRRVAQLLSPPVPPAEPCDPGNGMPPAPPSDPAGPRQLIINHLPNAADENTLATLFGRVAYDVPCAVEKVVLPKHSNGNHKGYAFVYLGHHAGALTAVRALNGAIWADRRITVGWSTRQHAPQSELHSSASDSTSAQVTPPPTKPPTVVNGPSAIRLEAIA